MVQVQTAGGNAAAPLNQFIPTKVEINTGQSITWINPTTIEHSMRAYIQPKR